MLDSVEIAIVVVRYALPEAVEQTMALRRRERRCPDDWSEGRDGIVYGGAERPGGAIDVGKRAAQTHEKGDRACCTERAIHTYGTRDLRYRFA